MKKTVLIVVTSALMVSAAFSVMAQDRRDRGHRAERVALTANQIVAQADAHTAQIKADLRLTPEQEKNWPGIATALHDIGKNRADRMVSFRAEREQKKDPGDVIEYLNSHAKFLGERSVNVKKLSDAAQPLYVSLDDQQKRRFADELMRFSRGRDID